MSVKEHFTKDNLKNCHIVIGPPRTGTSLLCNILSKAGIDFGPQTKTKNIHNPKGFFEDKGLVKHNKRLFRHMCKDSDFGYFLSRTKWERAKEIWLSYRVKNQLQRIRKETKGNWGIKDPRLCITFRRLYSYFKDSELIFIVRNPAEMSYSGISSGAFSPQKSFQLWNECVLNILYYRDQFGGTLILHQKLLKKDQKTLEKIKKFSQYNKDEIFDVIKPKYYRSKNIFPLPSFTEKLWEKVLEVENE